jgi:hypothetical protein
MSGAWPMFHPLECSRAQSHTNKRVTCHCYAASPCPQLPQSRCCPLGASAALFADHGRPDEWSLQAKRAQPHNQGRHSGCRLSCLHVEADIPRRVSLSTCFLNPLICFTALVFAPFTSIVSFFSTFHSTLLPGSLVDLSAQEESKHLRP